MIKYLIISKEMQTTQYKTQKNLIVNFKNKKDDFCKIFSNIIIQMTYLLTLS